MAGGQAEYDEFYASIEIHLSMMSFVNQRGEKVEDLVICNQQKNWK